MNYSKFDAAAYLKTDDDMAAYITAVLDENDPVLLMAALGDIARAKGMSAVAKEAGLNRESLYKALRPGSKPRFDTVFKIIRSLNIRLQATKADAQAG